MKIKALFVLYEAPIQNLLLYKTLTFISAYPGAFWANRTKQEGFKTSIDKLVGRMTNGRVLTKPAFNLWPVEGKPYVARLIAEVLLGLLFTN